jgi:hypothetical protein
MSQPCRSLHVKRKRALKGVFSLPSPQTDTFFPFVFCSDAGFIISFIGIYGKITDLLIWVVKRAVEGTHLKQNKGQYLAVVNTAVNLRLSVKWQSD